MKYSGAVVRKALMFVPCYPSDADVLPDDVDDVRAVDEATSCGAGVRPKFLGVCRLLPGFANRSEAESVKDG